MATRISSLTTHLSGGSFVSPSLVSLRALSSMSDASREMTGNASDRSIGEASITFPLHDLLPRRPTGADEVEGHGRNTVIAVLDTGVDPLAPGLRETSDGKIKVVDVVDCSGAGDVILTGPLTSSAGFVISPTTARNLKLPAHPNPSGNYYMGSKRGYEIYPAPLVARLKKERREKVEREHHLLVANLMREIAALERKKSEGKSKPGVSKDVKDSTNSDAPKESKEPNEPPQPDLEAQLTDKQSLVATLHALLSTSQDPGPIHDCLVFHDGSSWVASIDALESSDLSTQPVLAPYHVKQECGTFPGLLTFSVNIYDVPNTAADPPPVLSIVTNAGSHGTHVAAISSAFHGDAHAENGVAPGSQIVSLKIGDTRLGSMETGHALSRAVRYLSQPLPSSFDERRVDVANMSYGEPTSLPSLGRFPALLQRLVDSGLTFIASGGNEGPGLSTVGAPGGTVEGVIGVGAFVTPGMMRAGYGVFDSGVLGDSSTSSVAGTPFNESGKPYTFSSLGPTSDGAHGISVYAPGGAVTSIPRYNLAPTQLMNGTSMSSPNLAGGVSLLLSELRGKEMGWTPAGVKRALENTGKEINDPLLRGLAQLPAALSWLTSRSGSLDPFELSYRIAIPDLPSPTGTPARGVYLRDPKTEVSTAVHVQPVFPGDLADPGSGKWDELKANMDLRLSLRCIYRSSRTDSLGAAEWVLHPTHLALNNGGKSFPIRITPSSLPEGLHFAEIQAFIEGREDKGPLWRVPITVLKPGPVEDTVRMRGLEFTPGVVVRRFVTAPVHANFGTVKVSAKPRSGSARFMLQINYGNSLPISRPKKSESEYVFTLGGEEGDIQTRNFRVLPGQTMEVCLAQFWNAAGRTVVDLDLEFRGIWVSGGSGVIGHGNLGGGGIWINGGSGPSTRVEIWSPIRREKLNLSASLDTLRKSISPNRDLTTLHPLGERDRTPDGTQLHALTLHYDFKLPSSTESSTTLHFPWITELLYDSPYDGFLMILYDHSKRVLAVRDVYPKPISLKPGEYSVRAQIVSPDLGSLERIRKEGWPMCLDVKVKEGKISVFPSVAGALLKDGKGGFGEKVIEKGERRAVFLGAPGEVPKEAAPGDVMLGEFKIWGGAVGGSNGAGIDGGLVAVSYVVPPEPGKGKNGKPEKKEEKSEEEVLKEAVRDAEIGMLGKLKDASKRDALFAKLESEWPDHLPLLAAKLDSLHCTATTDADKLLKQPALDVDAARSLISSIESTVSLANRIIALADGTSKSGQNELALYFAGKPDTSTDSAKAVKKEMDSRKDSMVSAMLKRVLVKKAGVEVSEALARADSETIPTAPFDSFLAAYAEYAKWSEAAPEKDASLLQLYVWKSKREGLPGAALKSIQAYLDNPPASDCVRGKSTIKEVEEVKEKLLVELWGEDNVWVRDVRAWAVVKYPKDFASF